MLTRQEFAEAVDTDNLLGQQHDERWNKRALRAIDALRALMFFDRCWIGGGNARRLDTDKLPDDVTIVENTAGILGGIKLWDGSHVGL